VTLLVPGIADLPWLLVALAAAYLVGSIPWAYIIVKRVTGEDITAHGTGNVGAMNVRRTTGSWGWFVVAMLADGLKGLVPVLVVRVFGWRAALPADMTQLLAAATMIGCVIGHNWSLWLSIAKRRVLGGKGLATGAGALLAYDWRYFAIVLVTGLAVIALTRYMMAGQVAATLVLPGYTLLTRQPDWPYIVVLGAIVYARHHSRFVGLLRGREPKLYIHDRQGPRG
jgi:glycerol-3-phosphate acyltransferase PlsY